MSVCVSVCLCVCLSVCLIWSPDLTLTCHFPTLSSYLPPLPSLAMKKLTRRYFRYIQDSKTMLCHSISPPWFPALPSRSGSRTDVCTHQDHRKPWGFLFQTVPSSIQIRRRPRPRLSRTKMQVAMDIGMERRPENRKIARSEPMTAIGKEIRDVH